MTARLPHQSLKRPLLPARRISGDRRGILAILTLALAIIIMLAMSGKSVWSASLTHRYRLTAVNNFGSNPGHLRMFKYVPASLPAKPALVVAMHGCTQNAQDLADHSGWPQLADRMKFLLVFPQQRLSNNAARCFNWFEIFDITRGSGEALSIKQMVDRMENDYSVDSSRVYVTGLSAGGAMASVMLATYPDVFAGGAIMSGLPYHCATQLTQSLVCMGAARHLTPEQWGDLVRSASPSRTSWPIVSIWQGAADETVNPANAEEEVEQWTNVHGLSQSPSLTNDLGRAVHQVFKTKSGKAVVELYLIKNMGHGQAVNPGTGPTECGSPARYFLNVGICSAYYAARFWGLDK